MATPPALPPEQGGGPRRQLQKQQQQVSLRGKSAKEISRDALLQKVSHERELRSYIRRASAAALFIQRVWRRYHLMKHVAGKLQEEWEESVDHKILCRTACWVSDRLLRPFLFFTAQLTMKRKLQVEDIKCLLKCFEILLRSINSSESMYNFCSLAIGTSAERSTWLYQAKKLASLCSFLLAECDPKCHVGEGMVQVTSLGMHVLVCLTDPKGWEKFASENIGSLSSVIKRLLRHMVTKKSCLYYSIRKYILKLTTHIVCHKKSSFASDDHFLITASAITLALRPFHAKKLGIDDFGDLEVVAAEEYYISILTIPYLLQRLPPILLPALGHESSLLPCLIVQLNSKEKLFAEMLLIDQLGESGELSNTMEGIPCVGWALANILNLSTGRCSNSGDSACFIQGLDFQLYADAVGCLSGNFLCWLEKFRDLNTGNEDRDSNGSVSETVYSDAGVKLANIGTSDMSYINQLKIVHQQWHLRVLIAAIEENRSIRAADISTSSGLRNLKLTDILFFYSHMLRIFHFLNPFVGSLPILNMLSFTPGFLPLLWKELEEHMFGSNRCNSIDSGPSRDYHAQWQGRTLEKKQKWVNVLHRITGKSDVESSYLSNDLIIPNQVEDNASDLWEIEPLMHDSQGISKHLSVLLHLFCAAYAHLLLVLDDIEFYEKQAPFTLEQQLKISTVLNNLVYFSFIHCGQNNKPHMEVAIRCLLLLYERDCRRKFCPASLWIGPARKGRLPIAAAARAHEAAYTNYHSGDVTAQKSSIITTMPHVFPFDERVQMFREFIKLDKVARRMAGELDGLGTEIVIRRNHIVEDGYKQLNSLGSRLKSRFNVSFVNESGLPEVGLDYGGLSKEFLTDLSKLAFCPEYGLFIQTSTSERLLIPNISARFIDNGIDMIEFLGRIVGKALYEGILLDYSFSHTFVQKLLGRYSFLDELSTLDPELYRNLMYVKHYDGDVKDLFLDFTVTEDICGKRVTTELKPGGKDVLVTNDNKLQYVYAISDYKLNRQMLPLANAFFRGLTDLISPSWLRLFNANEFNQLLSGGKHDFDVDDLKRNTRYTGGYSEGSRTVKLFWEVVRDFESNERCMLLKFVTSCSRAPLLGFKYLQPSFTIHKVACDTTLWAMIGGQDVDRLPSASTCYNTLKLPTYKRSSTLKGKLLYAISSNSGFELS